MELLVTFLKLVGIGFFIQIFCVLAARFVFWLDDKYWIDETAKYVEPTPMSDKGGLGCGVVFTVNIFSPIVIGLALGYSWGIFLIYLGQIVGIFLLVFYSLSRIEDNDQSQYD